MNGTDETTENYFALAMAILTDKSAQQVLMEMEMVPERSVLTGLSKQEHDAEIVRRYESGQKITAIEREMGVHRQTIYNAFSAAGIKLKRGYG